MSIQERTALEHEILATVIDAREDANDAFDALSQRAAITEIVPAMHDEAERILYARAAEVLGFVRASLPRLDLPDVSESDLRPLLANVLEAMAATRAFLDAKLLNEIERRELLGMDREAVVSTLTNNLRNGTQTFSEVRTRYRDHVGQGVESMARVATHIAQTAAL